jgi:large subunit ribosomal protein L15
LLVFRRATKNEKQKTKEEVMTFALNNLKANKGSSRGKIRLGRGIGSGKGKTCGRGGKGQTARRGVSINGFEGGQTPIHRRLPKRGFYNFTRKDYDVVNVADIQKAIDDKKITGSAINLEILKKAGLVKGRQDGVKLLGEGKLTAKIEVSVEKASPAAVKAVESAGGKVVIIKATSKAARPAEAGAKPASKAKDKAKNKAKSDSKTKKKAKK